MRVSIFADGNREGRTYGYERILDAPGCDVRRFGLGVLEMRNEDTRIPIPDRERSPKVQM